LSRTVSLSALKSVALCRFDLHICRDLVPDHTAGHDYGKSRMGGLVFLKMVFAGRSYLICIKFNADNSPIMARLSWW